MVGKTLGNFTISTLIGRGGMGEVYRAKDQKLGRDVAIKVLPEEFAKDADRVARFQREAKLLASLNHPNIAAIYGLEESEGIHFLVLELIEGVTLADRLKRGAIPLEEALKLALQITEALEAAHEKGVIHRDLKPANIKVTPDGKVKVLDFGLAKAFAGEQGEMILSDSPTLSVAATQQGVILGTAAYMSPEQARGETVDKKADVWAFGVVLFEMLTGRATFEGRSVSDVLASVLKSEPEWNRLPPNLHPRIRLLLERCLEKEPKNRYGVISDARIDIQKVLTDPSGVFLSAVPISQPQKKMRVDIPWIVAALAIGAIIAGVAVWKLKPPEPRQVTRFVHYLAENQQFIRTVYPLLAVSPDGRQFAYCTTDGLLLRSMGELDARRIANEYAAEPFFSPDGQWIGYWALRDGKLKKVSVNGGAPEVLCDVAGINVLGVSWSADDTIVYSENGKGIMRISAAGGIPETLIPNEKETLFHPRILPDGKTVIFTFGPPPYHIAVQSIQSNKRKVLFPGDDALYLPTGYLVYALGYNLRAVPFDLDTLQPEAPVPIVEDLYRSDPIYIPQYALSASGTLLYLPKGIAAGITKSALVWVDRNGKEEPVEGAQPDLYNNPRISPDGTRLALAITIDGNQDIWIWDLARKTPTRLTLDKGSDANPLWTLDGRRIAFSSFRDGSYGVYWKAADATGKDEPIVGSVFPALQGVQTIPSSWSSDGKIIVLMENLFGGSQTDYNIVALAMEGDHKYGPLLNQKYHESQPKISPNGKWMAYVSNESDKYEVYVRSYPEVDARRWQVSTNGGDSPLWSPDGRELFYRNGDAVMAAPVKTEPDFSFETPKALFRGAYRPGTPPGLSQWDVSPDGRRFLMMKEAGAAASTVGSAPRINIVLNWLEELKRRVPKK